MIQLLKIILLHDANAIEQLRLITGTVTQTPANKWDVLVELDWMCADLI